MSEVLLPPWIIPEVETHEWLDEGSSVFASAFAPGLAQRQSYGGLRLKLHRRHTVRLDEKAQLLSVLAKTRGRFNAMRTKVHFATRGSGLGSELITNNTFSNGTTGWTSNSAITSLNVTDRMLRLLRTGGVTVTTISGPDITGVLYAPYVARVFMRTGRGPTLWDVRIKDVSDGTSYVSTAQSMTEDGYTSCAGVPYATDIEIGIVDRSTGKMAGDYMDVSYTSISRCPLVDNGLNDLLRSDEFDNASWTKNQSTATANQFTAPDGTLTGERLSETTVSDAHYVQQSVAKAATDQDWSFTVSVRIGDQANARDFIQLQVTEASSANSVTCSFDVSTGTVFSTPANNGTFTNARAFIVSLGNGWYACTLVGRVPSTTTTLFGRIVMSTNGSTISYAGSTDADVGIWRATLVQSSVPTRLISTTTTASTGTSQTGNALHLKGLEASEDGLLLPGDWFEINGELKQAIAALNSDAAGLGCLQFEPALVRSPADNDPVIITDPMGKFLVSNIKIDNEFGTQARVSYDLELIYE